MNTHRDHKSRNRNVEIARKNGVFSLLGSLRGLGRLGGGRTRARTWDPMIKSHLLDYSGRASQKQMDHRTKTEHLATILLPNPVATHDTEQDAVDGVAKILKENKTKLNGSSSTDTTITAFRVRCVRPRLCGRAR